ncbi:MAG: HAMP domain-containing histidine kinase, partial [Proteobacteria bacterium]
ARVTQYGPEQIIHEYQILRDLVLEDLSDRTELRSRDLKVIQGSFDQALQDAMMAYFAVHSRLREQFIAVLTHDLRSPIAVMSMAADAIVESSEKPSESDLEDIRDMASRIKANAKRADRLIQNMLDVTLVQVGEAPGLHIQSGNLESVVEAAAFDRSRSELSRLEVNTESALGFWDIEALQRSIENLVSNAFKYGRPDTPVRVTAKPAFGRVMIMVHNEGNPIPAKDRENLFQAFKRSDSAVKSGKKGWGIGLSLVRSTCEALGGSLGVESSEEKGTTFTIDIPQDARPLVGAPITT